MYIYSYGINNMSGISVCIIIIGLALIVFVYITDSECSDACVLGFCVGILIALTIIVETYDEFWIFK